MKKVILMLSIVAVAGLWGCSEDPERPKLTVSETTLLVPENGTAIVLEHIRNIAFAWEKAFLVDGYELVLSKSEDLSDPVTFRTTRSPYLVPAVDMNDIASGFGIASGFTGTIYWSVRSLKSSQPAEAEVRSLSLTRLKSQPLAPARDTRIVLDHEDLAAEIEFVWEPMPDVAGYTLIISTKADLSDPLVSLEVATTSGTVTQQTFNDVIMNTANGMKRYKSNPFYWNVKAGDKLLANQAWTLNVAGTRIYEDVRGDETIVYDVGVFPTADGTDEIIWLCENLRATKYVDGTDLHAGTGQEDTDAVYFKGIEAMGSAGNLLPEGIREHAGNYYRINKIGTNSSSSLEWPELLLQPGWSAPTFQDFTNLIDAASKVSSLCEALRHPDGYPDMKASVALNEEFMNVWNMNMVPYGLGRFSSIWVADFAAYGNGFIPLATNKLDYFTIIEVVYGNPSKIQARDVAWSAYASGPITVRPVYTGDN